MRIFRSRPLVRPSIRRAALAVVAPVLAAVPLVAARTAPAPFSVTSISVAPASVWQINRPIDFAFSAPVDLATVNVNTIRIVRDDGVQAFGTYSLLDALTVRFQPDCPLLADASDGGLTPGYAYTIALPGVLESAATVQSTSGDPLRPGLAAVPFSTSSFGPGLFVDAVVGPPAPVIQSSPSELDATYLEIGGEPASRVYFVAPAVVDPALGATTPAGFLAPLNLYSVPRSRVALVVQLDQSIALGAANLERVRLEYESAASIWSVMPRTATLAANCIASGSQVRVAPLGILPQARRVRVVLSSGFSDIAGEALASDLVVGSFTVQTAFDPGTRTPGDTADEVLEEFDVGAADSPASLEDTASDFPDAPAVWGDDGKLTGAFDFDGTGGPGGSFDWVVSQNFVLDTSFTVIVNAQQTAQQSVIQGLVDVRDFRVLPGVTLTIQGPNPCRILASGRVEIGGTVRINGVSNKGVVTLNATSIPEPGAAGNGGGGRGGAANYLTTQSTPIGESGYGAFQVAGGGGGGGESSFNASSNDQHRRPGGGGGGGLGGDAIRPSGTVATPVNGFTQPNPLDCPDQIAIGLDAENGFPGWPTHHNAGAGNPPIASGNNGALHPGEQPRGGTKGPRPFYDANPANDFWGTMVTASGEIVPGELLQPWAGAGGGGGGNAIHSSSFPLTPFTPTGDEKGAGGGGGGGSLTILALGEIKLLLAGRIEAKGGTGGGGENSSSVGTVERIGGASGGGSGGHIVLQSAIEIDLSECRSASPNNGGIYALGGQGGAGALNLGGSPTNGVQTMPHLDALPPRAYNSTTDLATTAPCSMSQVFGGYGTGSSANNTVGNTLPTAANAWNGGSRVTVVAGAGGDGGPGIIQLHAPTLADILPPTTAGESLYKCVKPPPVGATSNDVNTPSEWDHLVPRFGTTSRAQSKWIALGSANVDATSGQLDAVDLRFEGTQGGLVQTARLAPILAGVIAAEPQRPYIASDQRTIVFDGGALADDLYLRNPALLRRFELELTRAASTESFEVASAAYDPVGGGLYVTVSRGGMPLAPFGPGDQVLLRPRFFRVSSDGVLDTLAPSSSITIEFQAAPADAGGAPDEQVGPTHASDWTADVDAIDAHPNAAQFRFVRFRVRFELATGGQTLSPSTPVPSLEFLRIPFRF